eukprot:7046660-Pyramimonas_sp.AAC.1
MERVRVVPKWVCATHAGGGTAAFGGASCKATSAEKGVRDACGRWHWGLRWITLWGHETCE